MPMLKDYLLDHYKLNDSIKHYKGYKVRSPEETINLIKSYFEKIDLTVKYVPLGKSALEGYSPFQSGNGLLNPKDNDNINLLRTNGKGVTPRLSQASATAELIERFVGYGKAPGLIKHYLSAMKIEEDWRKKAEKNDFFTQNFPFHSIVTLDYIPNSEIDKFHKMKKSICYSLTSKKLYSYPEEFLVKLLGSHGLASGNTKEEAMLHAICECIERLSGCYLLENLPKCNKISIDSITHPTLIQLIEVVKEIGVEFELLDFSFLFDIPIIITIFDHKKWSLSPIKYANLIKQYPLTVIGVDTDPEDAAMRCFTEFLQGLLPFQDAFSTECQIRKQFSISQIKIPYEIQNRLNTPYVCFRNNNQPASVDLSKYLKSDRKEVSIKEINNLYDINNKVEIERIIPLLRDKNIEVFIQDITNPILPFPVTATFLTGGNGYFSQIPLNGYFDLVIGTKDNDKRFLLLKQKISEILSPSKLFNIIQNRNWNTEIYQEDLLNLIINDLFKNGNNVSLWGEPIDKFYFLGLLYIRMKRYREAMNCVDAVLSNNLHNLYATLAKAYIYQKTNRIEDFNKIMDHAEQINFQKIDILQTLKKFDDPIFSPNPFEPCDQECNKKNNPKLCEKCFFNYASGDIFNRRIIDDVID